MSKRLVTAWNEMYAGTKNVKKQKNAILQLFTYHTLLKTTMTFMIFLIFFRLQIRDRDFQITKSCPTCLGLTRME
jgi:hypothetical protein